MDEISVDHLKTTTRSVRKRLDLRRAIDPRIIQDPDDVTQVCLLPVAYFSGDDFKPATRVPGRECTYWDAWSHTSALDDANHAG